MKVLHDILACPIIMEFPLEESPEIIIRELPSSFEEVSHFYHDLNATRCFVHCQHKDCLGHQNKLPLTYGYATHNPTARCRVCKRCVKAVPGIKFISKNYYNHFFFFFLGGGGGVAGVIGHKTENSRLSCLCIF